MDFFKKKNPFSEKLRATNVISYGEPFGHIVCIHPLTLATKMIFIGFLLISGIFFLFAHFAGGMQYFFNSDSVAIPLIIVSIFSLFTFRRRVFWKGIRCMFLFRVRDFEKDENVGRHYFSVMIVAIAAGVCSTFQGMISGILVGALDHEGRD